MAACPEAAWENGVTRQLSSRIHIGDAPAAPMPQAQKVRGAMIAILSALGSALFGLDIGYIGPIWESEAVKVDVAHIKVADKIDAGLDGLIVSLFSIGSSVMVLSPNSNLSLEGLGRKASISWVLGQLRFHNRELGSGDGEQHVRAFGRPHRCRHVHGLVI